MKYKNLKVLLGAFTAEDKLIELFELIEDVDKVNQDELDFKILTAFQLYLQYSYNPDLESDEIICKCMFVYKEDYWNSYIYDDKNQVQPTDLKVMSAYYKQDINGEITKIYE